MSELRTFGSERICWAVEQVEREAGDIDTLHLDDTLFYIKSEADRVIAELKRNVDNWTDSYEISRKLNAELETENYKLKRTLWLARADRAMMTLDYFTLKCRWFKDYMKIEPPQCDVKMIHKWANVERKCRAKAEEYK